MLFNFMLLLSIALMFYYCTALVCKQHLNIEAGRDGATNVCRVSSSLTLHYILIAVK